MNRKDSTAVKPKREPRKWEAKNVSEKDQKRWNCLGHTLRIIHFILNAFTWVIGNLAIFGGFIIGFSTNTVLFPFKNMDFMATTPVILFVEYGLLLVIVASIGCFTGTGANPIAIIIYIVCAIIILIVDLAWGVCLYFWPDALPIFMRKVKASMNGYEVDDAHSIGIYPLDPKVYWDHIQLRGKCCGTEIWDEWINTTIGNKHHSLPYSCCNDDFRYAECGEKLLGPYMHPFSEHHELQDMVFQMGCFAKLPRAFLRSFKESGSVGVIVGTVIILAILIAIVLLALIITKLYDPDERNKMKNNDEPPRPFRQRRNALTDEDADDIRRRRNRDKENDRPPKNPYREVSFSDTNVPKKKRISAPDTRSLPREESMGYKEDW